MRLKSKERRKQGVRRGAAILPSALGSLNRSRPEQTELQCLHRRLSQPWVVRVITKPCCGRSCDTTTESPGILSSAGMEVAVGILTRLPGSSFRVPAVDGGEKVGRS